MKTLFKFITFTMCCCISFAAVYSEQKFDKLIIAEAWIRQPIANNPVTSGYMTINNAGTTDKTLMSITAKFAKKSQLHETFIDGDTMKMRSLKNGILIPAGETVYLKPGSHHIMFMKFAQHLKHLESKNVTLIFKTGHSVTVKMTVKPVHMEMSSHSH